VTPELRAGLEALIGRETGSPVLVAALDRLRGGTMRHAWALDVEVAVGLLAGRHRLVYLEERGGSPFPGRLDGRQEFELLRAMHRAGVRVPKPYWRVDPGDPSGVAAGLVVERVPGETLPRRILEDPALGPVREGLLGELGGELARIHALPAAAAPCLPWLPDGASPAESLLGQLDRLLGELGEPHPALDLALRWLGRRPPRAERVVLVHGDYRLGNFVVDPERGLTAVLDWELAHWGDPGEDLGWVAMRYWRGVDHPGDRGLGPRARLLAAYAAVGGHRVDPEGVRYWEVMGNLRWALITLRQAERHLRREERGLELASIGRHCAEVERELLQLLRTL